MKTNEAVRSIVDALKALYPDGICSLNYEKDYELLFSVRLAAQCTDERVLCPKADSLIMQSHRPVW